MDQRINHSRGVSTTAAGAGPVSCATSEGAATEAPARAPYTSPRLERLGSWRALTLQQSVPIFP